MMTPITKSCRLLHTTFLSSAQRVEPERSRELIDSAIDVPIINTNLAGEGNIKCEKIKQKQEVRKIQGEFVETMSIKSNSWLKNKRNWWRFYCFSLIYSIVVCLVWKLFSNPDISKLWYKNKNTNNIADKLKQKRRNLCHQIWISKKNVLQHLYFIYIFI